MFQHENLSYKSFITENSPALWYMYMYMYTMYKVTAVHIPLYNSLDVLGHGGTEQHHLLGLGALFEKPVDLLLEIWGKKLISFIKNQKLYIVNSLEQ